MGGKSAPDPPDYTAAAQATANSNRASMNAQTTANRPNQYTPFGDQTWTSSQNFDRGGYDRAMQDWNEQLRRADSDEARDQLLALRPSQNDYYTTSWDQTTTLDPELQGALDSQIDLQRGRSDLANSLFPRAQNEFGEAMDWSGFTPFQMGPEAQTYGEGLTDFAGAPQTRQYGQDLTPFNMGPGTNQYSSENIQRGIGDSSMGYVDRAGDAIYSQWASRAEPQFQQASDQLDVKLRNQGLKPGDQAYDQAIKDLRTSQGDARTNASYQATIGSGAEGSRLQGMDLNAGNFANNASRQSLEQQLALGGARFGEGSQVADRQNDIRGRQLDEQFGIGDRGYAQDMQNAAYINALRGQQLGEQLQTGDRRFSQEMASANQNNTIRQQQIAEEMQRRGFSLNEINAIISGQQVGMPSMPNFNAAGNAGGTNYSGAAQNQYQGQLDQFNASQGALQGLFGGVAGLTSAFMPFGFGG